MAGLHIDRYLSGEYYGEDEFSVTGAVDVLRKIGLSRSEGIFAHYETVAVATRALVEFGLDVYLLRGDAQGDLLISFLDNEGMVNRTYSHLHGRGELKGRFLGGRNNYGCVIAEGLNERAFQQVKALGKALYLMTYLVDFKHREETVSDVLRGDNFGSAYEQLLELPALLADAGLRAEIDEVICEERRLFDMRMETLRLANASRLIALMKKKAEFPHGIVH